MLQYKIRIATHNILKKIMMIHKHNRFVTHNKALYYFPSDRNSLLKAMLFICKINNFVSDKSFRPSKFCSQ